ncbi:MAG: hydrogenase formation protein HypD, partial [bacterium]|nr:hydrogenase formation protein HypD [bacterium]
GIASTVLQARDRGLSNFSVYTSQKLVLPAMEAVLDGASNIAGFLTPGHVSVILGPEAYEGLVAKYSVPCVATGFEPQDVLEGIAMLLECIADSSLGSFVQYTRVVKPGGNAKAREVLMTAFEESDADWRGIGVIPRSGLTLRSELRAFDAACRYDLPDLDPIHLPGCRCGEVLKGLIHPPECPFFGKKCTPRNPLGPCMVSSEGSCAARYKYG